MILQVLSRVNDVRDLCEKRCEQFRQLIKPMYRPVQRIQPLIFPQNETFNLIGITTSIIPQQQQLNEHVDKDSNLSLHDSNAKMDKKQRYDKKVERSEFFKIQFF
jgi:hypothetical protein